MDLSNLPAGMVGQLANMVQDYILNSQKKYLARGVYLTPEQNSAMQPFFPGEILSQVRLVRLEGERVQDPPFYGMARMMGIKNLPSFGDASAVTFVDVIVSHQDFSDTLLFHELVHAVQYAQLGSKEFSSRYLDGFLKSGSYEGNPLEKHAFDLERRYAADKSQVFSVAEEVKQWISQPQ